MQPGDSRWCVAVVHAADGVRFLTTAPTRAALAPRLAAYVGEQAAWKLWPAHAARVRDLLRAGALDDAVELYFASVRERWDSEWLHAEEIAPVDGDNR
jgi:hypothetical protein